TGRFPRLPCSCAPPLDERVLESKQIQAAADYEIHEVVHGLGAVVEARRRKEDRRARPPQGEHVLEMDGRERRLPRDEHEPALLLERDRGGPVDQVLHRAGGDRPEGAHRAWTDYVGIDLRGSRRIRSAPVLRVVERRLPARVLEQALERLVRGETRVAAELGREHLDARARGAHADLPVGGRQRLEEPGRVRRPRGARYAEEDSQGATSTSAPSTPRGTQRARAAPPGRAP